MKILTINWSYKNYSVGKIIKDIESSLAGRENGRSQDVGNENDLRQDTGNKEILHCNSTVEFVHCYEFGEKSQDPNAYRLSGRVEYKIYWILGHLTGLQYASGLFSNVRLRHIIKRERPDVVHVHCPNAFSINLYQLFDFLKTRNIPTVITNHAEFYFTGNCAYADECRQYLTGCMACRRGKEVTHSWLFNRTASAWRRMKKAFEDYDRIQLVAVSPWAEKRIKESVILGALPCCTIYNGIDTDVFHPSNTYHELHKELIHSASYSAPKDKERQVVLLHVTSRFSDEEADPKGGEYILRLAERLQQKKANYRIVVAGTTALQKAHDELHNIEFLGQIQDQHQLAALYSSADLLVMTSKRETFGMTCAESMCCGTPVVGFENGGTESIALTEYSEFVPFGDLDALESAVARWSGRKAECGRSLAEDAIKAYSKETMAESYYALYKSMV